MFIKLGIPRYSFHSVLPQFFVSSSICSIFPWPNLSSSRIILKISLHMFGKGILRWVLSARRDPWCGRGAEVPLKLTWKSNINIRSLTVHVSRTHLILHVLYEYATRVLPYGLTTTRVRADLTPWRSCYITVCAADLFRCSEARYTECRLQWTRVYEQLSQRSVRRVGASRTAVRCLSRI